jgi:hypothetical protein
MPKIPRALLCASAATYLPVAGDMSVWNFMSAKINKFGKTRAVFYKDIFLFV